MTEWLTATLLATSLLMALVLIIREPVRTAFGPAAAYGLWLVPALRMLMPPLTQTVERVVPAAAPLPVQAIRPATAFAAQPGLVERLGGWPAIALFAWAAGAAIMLVGGILIYRWQRREVLRDAVQLARHAGVRLVRSPAVRGPLAFGILDRVIALPTDFDERFSPDERRLAFDHELAHHRSGDLVVGHLAFLFLCLQWFNPLAWLSHAAFRFDQEAACDARVLDKANGGNRADYAQAITKAASGRALLFAAALDRPRTLHRRLKSMLTSPSPARRNAGKAVILVAAAAALPLTASRATEYVDVPSPAVKATAAAQPVLAAAPATSPAAIASSAAAVQTSDPAARGDLPMPDLHGVTLGKGDVAFMDDDSVLIDGRRMRLEQLDAGQRVRLRSALLRSQKDLAREEADLPARLAEAHQTLERIHSGAFKREHLQDIADMQNDLAELAARAAQFRAEGEDPEKRKAEILRDLKEAQSVDIDKAIADALRESDPAKITAELRSAEQQMNRILARLDQLDRQ